MRGIALIALIGCIPVGMVMAIQYSLDFLIRRFEED